ncbi:sigma factor-like helix-turn-helix DNA-binding protein [Actinoplanes sp. URMC 104]|uniref:sigma factor-like helix-turn-helix DNA-binding protein n=1 Tax=Actinoplanes sp. URMC 104 TaxID=3423409 RepID=UPI003F1CF382
MPTRPAGPSSGRETRRPETDQLLRALPAHHREIIVATYFRGRTTREAARQLGLTHHAAKARLYHAMRDLSDLLAPRTGRHRSTRCEGPRPGISR